MKKYYDPLNCILWVPFSKTNYFRDCFYGGLGFFLPWGFSEAEGNDLLKLQYTKQSFKKGTVQLHYLKQI